MSKSTKTDTADYEVGYQKPPKSTRFAKGQSGNPSGRPKGTRNWATVLNAALEQKVTINEGGRQRQVTKLEAAIMQLINKAAAGDAHAIRLILQIVPSMEAIINKVGVTSLSKAQDQIVLNELLKRLHAPDLEEIVLENPQDMEGAAS
jgi:hypothetical protein